MKKAVSRRDFIKGAAVVAASAVLAGCDESEIPSDSQYPSSSSETPGSSISSSSSSSSTSDSSSSSNCR